jgi:hypothetical protein
MSNPNDRKESSGSIFDSMYPYRGQLESHREHGPAIERHPGSAVRLFEVLLLARLAADGQTAP